MAKGRKLTTDISRTERYMGTINYNQSHETTVNITNNESDFEEDEVWSTIHDDPVINRNDHTEWPPRATARSRRKGKLVGGLSMAFDDSTNNIPSSSSKSIRHQCVAASAPVNVPGWSRVYGADPIGSFCELDDGLADSGIVPPHEYVGQKVAANSVFEGAGRTLKGRDMTRVRDAVWSQTGFYG